MAFASVTNSGNIATSELSSVSSGAGALLTVHDVAGFLRVPLSWVYERTRRRGRERLPHMKVGKYLRFRQSDLEAYVETLRRE